MLDKAAILERQEKARYSDERVESLDGELRFRKLTAGAVVNAQNQKDADARLIAKSVVDENGDQMFTPAEAGELSADVFSELGRIIARLNGWNTDPEDAEKN